MSKQRESGIKIKIEFSTTTTAKVTINGRELKLIGKATDFGSQWAYSGLLHSELENTIGGMIASKLKSNLIDILQAWIPDGVDNPPKAWERLEESTANWIYDQMEV